MSAKVEVKEGDRYGLLTIIKEVEPKTFDRKGVAKRRVHRKNMPVIGVVLLEHTDKWTASIRDGDSIKYLGVYDTFDEAVEAFRNGA